MQEEILFIDRCVGMVLTSKIDQETNTIVAPEAECKSMETWSFLNLASILLLRFQHRYKDTVLLVV